MAEIGPRQHAGEVTSPSKRLAVSIPANSVGKGSSPPTRSAEETSIELKLADKVNYEGDFSGVRCGIMGHII